VITLGRRADAADVLWDPARLRAEGLEVRHAERAGEVTVHCPGQLVVYPILDLRRHRPDVRWYARALLQSAGQVAAHLGVATEVRLGTETGLWTADGAKLAALGVRIERWVTYHGLALNVDPDLAWFESIVPCGMPGAGVTSLAHQLGRRVTVAEVTPLVLAALAAELGLGVTSDPKGVRIPA
jgi:lipoate-protein ligase B